MSWAIVAATATPMNAPTKFSTAAATIAACGGTARVETAVEIRSKVSWNPLREGERKRRHHDEHHGEIASHDATQAAQAGTREDRRVRTHSGA